MCHLHRCFSEMKFRAILISGLSTIVFYQSDALKAVGCSYFPQHIDSDGQGHYDTR